MILFLIQSWYIVTCFICTGIAKPLMVDHQNDLSLTFWYFIYKIILKLFIELLLHILYSFLLHYLLTNSWSYVYSGSGYTLHLRTIFFLRWVDSVPVSGDETRLTLLFRSRGFTHSTPRNILSFTTNGSL